MKEIKLTHGLVVMVDDEDYLFLNRWTWHYDNNGNTNYAAMLIYDANVGKQVKIYMHRLIMGMPGTMYIDHIDHNGLNNQKSNLRICTHRQNLLNSTRRHKNPKSKYRGVTITDDGCIIAYMTNNGKRTHLGTFKSEEDAAKVRDLAVINSDRKFYVLNFPVDGIKEVKQ